MQVAPGAGFVKQSRAVLEQLGADASVTPCVGERVVWGVSEGAYRPRSSPLTFSNTRSGGGSPFLAFSAACFS
jgi:hypothetical protein